jgi:hypothetical protein
LEKDEFAWIREINLKDLRHTMGSKCRHLMVNALAVTIKDGDHDAVLDIIKFCKSRRILLHVSVSTLRVMIKAGDYHMMMLLIQNFCYLRQKTNFKTSAHLLLEDGVDHDKSFDDRGIVN